MVNLRKAFHTSVDPGAPVPPRETVNARIIVLALFGACAAVLFGYDLGFIGGVVTLPAFAKDYHLDKKTAAERTAFASNVVSVFQAGAVFGAMASATVADRVGRKIALMGNLFIYLVGAVLMTAAGGSAGVGLVYAGRVLTGWGVGASTMLVPVYVAECSPPHIRGRLVGLYEVGVQFGTMVGFWIPYGVLKTLNGTPQWRIPFAIQMIPAFGCVVGLFFLTETPRFMVRRHGEARALKTIAHLRNLPEDHPYVQYELLGIMGQFEYERAQLGNTGHFSVVRETFSRRNARRLFTGCMIMIFFQMAGTNAVNYYSPRIFQSLGLSAASAKLFATGVYGVVRFVSTLIAMILFTDRFGRVSMIVTGGSIMAVCMWIVGALVKTYPPVVGADISAGQYAAIVLIFVWAVAFCFSYAGIPWIYCSEIFPLRIRTLCMAICTSVHWAFNLMLAKSTPYMIENLGGYGIYFVFASCTTVGAVFEFFYMPETKGRSLEEIGQLFGDDYEVPNVDRDESIEKREMDHVEGARV